MTEPSKQEGRTWTEEIEINAGELVDRVKKLIEEGNVRRLIIRKPNDEILLEVPLTAGVAVGVAVWFVQRPMDRDDVHVGLALGLGLATFLFGCLLCRGLPKPSAECPQCGCDWNIESENDMQKWLTWHCCPGCGLKMIDDTACEQKP